MLTAVLIDQREPEWVRRLTFGGALVATTLLEHGDFQIACDDGNVLLVERKTPSDLLNSLADGRLMVQMAEMSRVTIWAYLLVTGTIVPGPDGKVIADGAPTGWNFAAVQGALLSIQEMGCFVTWGAGNADLEGALTRLARRNRQGRMPIAPARTAIPLSPGEAALAALPGIGMDRLDAIMHHAQTPARALTYLTSSINGLIPGIGPQTRASVRKALGLADNQTFEIVTKGDPS